MRRRCTGTRRGALAGRLLGAVVAVLAVAGCAGPPSGAAPSGAAPSGQSPSGQAPPVTGPVDRNGWHLVWSDEFDGTSLHRAHWSVPDHSTFGDGNGELACLLDRPENVFVAGGLLHLVARREPAPVPCGPDDRRFPGGRSYSSAMVSTQGLASWTYGRFEVRARLPTRPGESGGLWPAIWMRPDDGGLGELDVLEAIGDERGPDGRGLVHHTVWSDYSGAVPNQTAAVALPHGDPSDGMHVYALEWRPGELRWFVDGVQTWRRDTGTTPWLAGVFDRPFFLRLNLAVGGSWPGPPGAATALPATVLIDDVRVYQGAGQAPT